MYNFECSGCGAKVEVLIDNTQTAVCKYCKTAHSLDNKIASNIGKVAEINTISRIQIGTKGVYLGYAFGVIGLYQVEYESGFWNEWHVLFSNGMTGWLAEYSGQYAMYVDYIQLVSNMRVDVLKKAGFIINNKFMLENKGRSNKEIYSHLNIPAFDKTELNSMVSMEPLLLTVATPIDIRTAHVARMVGELPFRLDNNCQKVLSLVDYSSKSGLISIDFSETQIISHIDNSIKTDNSLIDMYIGQETTFADLKLSNLIMTETEKNSKNITDNNIGVMGQSGSNASTNSTSQVKYKPIACPKCNQNARQIKPDDKTITCSNCRAVLEIKNGNATALNNGKNEYAAQARWDIRLPIGCRISCKSASIENKPVTCTSKNKDYEYECVGFRMCETDDGFIYHEYVLYCQIDNSYKYISWYKPQEGSEEGDKEQIILWSPITNVPGGSGAFSVIDYKGLDFSLSSDGQYGASTVYVEGSFPWVVKINSGSLVADFKHGPVSRPDAISLFPDYATDVIVDRGCNIWLSRETNTGNGSDISWAIGVEVRHEDIHSWFLPPKNVLGETVFSNVYVVEKINKLLSPGFWLINIVSFLLLMFSYKNNHWFIWLASCAAYYSIYASADVINVIDKKTKQLKDKRGNYVPFIMSVGVLLVALFIAMISEAESEDGYSSGSSHSGSGTGWTNGSGGFHK